jgi:hypothetical protein
MTAGHPTGPVWFCFPVIVGRARSGRASTPWCVTRRGELTVAAIADVDVLAVVLAALIMLAKASCWAFTMACALRPGRESA